jgi:sec-independent protein translocase protein TatA
MHLGFTELFLILVVVLLLFGARRIPEIARSLGRASQEYKKAKDDFLAEVNKPAEDLKDAIESDTSAQAAAAKEDKDSGSAKS